MAPAASQEPGRSLPANSGRSFHSSTSAAIPMGTEATSKPAANVKGVSGKGSHGVMCKMVATPR